MENKISLNKSQMSVVLKLANLLAYVIVIKLYSTRITIYKSINSLSFSFFNISWFSCLQITDVKENHQKALSYVNRNVKTLNSSYWKVSMYNISIYYNMLYCT